MRHLKKFENFDFQEKELVVPADVVNNEEEDELCPECNCKPCECDDAGAYEDDLRLEKFSAFNEKKAKRIKGEKSEKDDKKSEKDDKKEDDAKGKTPKTKKEKELAAKFPPKDKITKGDFIKAAIDNKKKKESKEK